MVQSLASVREVMGDASERGGKYLTFALGEEEYGLEILKVREIIGYIAVTSLPGSPDYVKGVINLRGQVIPVIDLRSKFGMEAVEISKETCIIVVEMSYGRRTASTGIVVDRVLEVITISAEQIAATPEFGVHVDTEFISGMGKIGDSVKILLDIDQVLSGTEMVGVVGISQDKAQVE